MMFKNVFIVLIITVMHVAVFANSKEELEAFQKITKSAASRIAPYMVQIKVKRTEDIPLPPPSFFLQDFEQLPSLQRSNWKEFLKEIIEVSKRPDAPVTGIIISSQGEIVTSYYNIAGVTEKIEVLFSDGQVYPAQIVATSQLDDIALLKINKETYAPSLRNSLFPVGSIAIVMGKSKSAENYTMNVGIVSGEKRYLGFSAQLDAKVNYGNSGGAVVNIYGELCGIANRVSHYAKSGQSSGVGFFTTTSRLRRILPLLKKGKNIPVPLKPFIGIRISRMLKYKDYFTVHVDSVFPETPAAKGGVKNDDIIVAINGQRITTRDDFSKMVNEIGIGNYITFKISRKGRLVEAKVLLEPRPILF